MALRPEFVRAAERLAAAYERNKEYGKALDVYGEILKLVPQYAQARAKFQLLRQRQATAQTASLEVRADRPWQPTGIQVLQGKPITIRATGVWTFHLTRKLGPDGMPIPEQLRDYNLGCLIGMIETGNPKEMKPFVVGSQKSFLAEQTGQLLLRMYDDQPADNEGTLRVQVMGTFEKR